MSVLRVPPGARSSEEVELLAAFLQQLEVRACVYKLYCTVADTLGPSCTGPALTAWFQVSWACHERAKCC